MDEPPQYLMDIEALKANAFADLGPMTTAGYEAFMRSAKAAAQQCGIANPKLIVGLINANGARNNAGVTSMPYPISEMEWDGILKGVGTIYAEAPIVYVVDGDRYVAPI